jgi:hypothetical protein
MAKSKVVSWKPDDFARGGTVIADFSIRDLVEALRRLLESADAEILEIETQALKDIDDAASRRIWDCIVQFTQCGKIKSVRVICERDTDAVLSLLSATGRDVQSFLPQKNKKNLFTYELHA